MRKYKQVNDLDRDFSRQSMQFKGDAYYAIPSLVNLPCLECDQCGEKYYTGTVAEKLRGLWNVPNL